jgi:alanine racemase
VTAPHDPSGGALAWCEVSTSALAHNVRCFRRRVGSEVRLGVVVKADAYGHGLALASRAFVEGGADVLVVNALFEAEALRAAGLSAPVYIVGNVPAWHAERAVATGASLVVYDADVVRALSAAAVATGREVAVHLKIETGNHRQGLPLPEALALGQLVASLPGLVIEGITTHFADIEDTTDHSFAASQLARFREAEVAFREAGLTVATPNTANSAAALLQPATHGGLVRVGIGAYGLWPSRETRVAAMAPASEAPSGAWGGFHPELRPALAWRARLVQVKAVPRGAWIGYGRTFRATSELRVAIVPVGYHEGYDRRLSNLGHVLVDGVRAPVRGRICMNMMMVDVTDIPTARTGAVATLLGVDGDEAVTADDLAAWMGTIHYEVVSRIHPSVPRVAVA